LSSSPTLLIAHEGQSGSFIRWLNELGLGDFLNRYPLSQLVEWGWVVPKYRVTFPPQFFENWPDYPYSPDDHPEALQNYGILWDYNWSIDNEDEPLWFLDPLFHPEDEVGELLRQYGYSDGNKLTPTAIEHVRGVPIKPYADYFYRWQGYALVDVIRFADSFEPIYSTPDVVARAQGLVRIAEHDTTHPGLNSPEGILTAPKRWAGLAPLLTWLDHFRAFREAVFNVQNTDSEAQQARYRRGAQLLAEHLGITHEILADAIKNHLLVLANDWIGANEKLDRRSFWTLRAWPLLQDDIQLAMIWLIVLSGKTFEDYDAEWRQPYMGNWGWLALDKALPYDFIVHQKKFIAYAPIYLKPFNETPKNPWPFDADSLPTLVRTFQRSNDSFAGFLAAFHEMHEHLSPKQFDKSGLDFRARRPLDQYALLAIRAEGCLRRKLDSLGLLNKITPDKQGLASYIKKLAEVSDIPQPVIGQFNAKQTELTSLHGEREDPIGTIQSIPKTLSNVNHQLVQAFLCCNLARNYFTHHVFLDHELRYSPKSEFLLRGILVSVLVLLGPP
jgi:hypothetical protein